MKNSKIKTSELQSINELTESELSPKFLMGFHTNIRGFYDAEIKEKDFLKHNNLKRLGGLSADMEDTQQAMITDISEGNISDLYRLTAMTTAMKTGRGDNKFSHECYTAMKKLALEDFRMTPSIWNSFEACGMRLFNKPDHVWQATVTEYVNEIEDINKNLTGKQQATVMTFSNLASWLKRRERGVGSEITYSMKDVYKASDALQIMCNPKATQDQREDAFEDFQNVDVTITKKQKGKSSIEYTDTAMNLMFDIRPKMKETKKS